MACWWEEFFDEDYLRVYRERDSLTAVGEAEFVRKTLRMRRGQQVLDVCCGYGRHAVLLARAGLCVTGLDCNAMFLKRGRRIAKQADVPVHWIQQDVRTMNFESRFSAALNLFTSIGYFENEEENFGLIDRTARALKPGGRFVLDTINRDRLIRNPQWRLWMPMGRGVVLDTPAFDWARGRLNSRRLVVHPDGRKRETRISLRLYTLAEIVTMFERAGLDVIRTCGDFDGCEYGVDSPRVIVIGRKPKRGQA